MSDCYFTPPKLAQRWQIKPERVIAFIRSGELRAFDVSSRPGIGRPRWRIPPDAVLEFEARRAAAAPPVQKPRRRRKRTEDRNFIRYFS